MMAFGLILGSAAIATALAFGLGGRDWAARRLEDWSGSGRPFPPPPPPRLRRPTEPGGEDERQPPLV
jgi:hypothetical protein